MAMVDLHSRVIDASATMRTRFVLAQPRLDTGEMEPVRARQYRDLGTQFDRIHADRTLRLAVEA